MKLWSKGICETKRKKKKPRTVSDFSFKNVSTLHTYCVSRKFKFKVLNVVKTSNVETKKLPAEVYYNYEKRKCWMRMVCLMKFPWELQLWQLRFLCKFHLVKCVKCSLNENKMVVRNYWELAFREVYFPLYFSFFLHLR